MGNTKKIRNLNSPMIRKGLYIIVGAVLWIAAYFGLVDEGKIDAIAASPAVGGAISFLAAYFVNRGSNSTATDEDVEQARREGEQKALARFTADPAVETYGRHSADPSAAAAANLVPDEPAAVLGVGEVEPGQYPGGVS